MFPENSRAPRFLLAALAGIGLLAVVLTVNEVPERIDRGRKGTAAIQLLDAMRRPLLAIEHTELEQALDESSGADARARFDAQVARLRKQLQAYHAASRYNATLADNVDTLAVLIKDWIRDEQAERDNPDAAPATPGHLLEERLRLLHTLTVLAEGEAPIHADIARGEAAERLLQWGGAALVCYLFLLIIFFQYSRQRELLDAFRALEQARDELKRRENYLSMTLDSIGDAVIATDARGRITRMNAVAETLTGWSADEARGRPLPEVFHIVNAHSRNPVDNPVEKVLASGQIIGLANHTVLIARDGHEYQIADSGAPIMDEKGKILGVILVFRDVTREYGQQEALQKSRRNLAEAQRLARLGNWELDLENDRLEWSEEIFRIFEIDPDGFKPSYEGFLELIHPDDRERVNQAYTESLENRQPYDIIHRLLLKDGNIKYVREYCQTDFDEHGKPRRSIGVVQDISETILLQQRLESAALEWELAMDTIEDAIYLIDLDDRVVRANRGFYQLTGLEASQVIGQDIKQIMHPEGEPEPCPVCQARQERRDLLLVMESDHPDNPVGRPLEIMLNVIRDRQGKPVNILMHLRDLTRQREIETRLRQHQQELESEVARRTEELTRINKELEAFSYSVSHDLRAPLRAINGFATALDEDYGKQLDETGRDYLRRISAGANRMAALIDDMLMLSRLNRQPLHRQDCDLSALAHVICEEQVEHHARAGIECIIAPGMRANCDHKLIRIALENLFSNAVKYSSKEASPRIEFGSREEEGREVFYVKDNGAGFDMRYSDKLFGAFQRLHGREFEGTGIGLATVQRIIHQHGGEVWAEGEVGKGATFYFTLG